MHVDCTYITNGHAYQLQQFNQKDIVNIYVAENSVDTVKANKIEDNDPGNTNDGISLVKVAGR